MDKLLRFGEGKILKQLKQIANQVNSIEEDFVAMRDDELIGQTAAKIRGFRPPEPGRPGATVSWPRWRSPSRKPARPGAVTSAAPPPP